MIIQTSKRTLALQCKILLNLLQRPPPESACARALSSRAQLSISQCTRSATTIRDVHADLGRFDYWNSNSPRRRMSQIYSKPSPHLTAPDQVRIGGANESTFSVNPPSHNFMNFPYGAFVFNCNPCHFFTSSPSTLFTSRCCLITGRPLNCSETMSSAYMDPQPPEIS